MTTEELYIVKSGQGYVFDSSTLEMIENPRNPIDGAMRAQRMPYNKAQQTVTALEEDGLQAQLIKINKGFIK